MSEEIIYPLRASGDWAGTKCPVRVCKKYCRFVVMPMGKPDAARGTCAIHLAAFTRTIQLLTGLSTVTQEVPGNWPRELIITEDELALLGSGTV